MIRSPSWMRWPMAPAILRPIINCYGSRGGFGGFGGTNGAARGRGGRGGAGGRGGFDPFGGAATAFGHVLIPDLIPYIDAHYRTLADQRHRAMAGLSMGGMETHTITMAHLDTFAYI